MRIKEDIAKDIDRKSKGIAIEVVIYICSDLVHLTGNQSSDSS